MLNAIICSFSMKMVCTFYKATDFKYFIFSRPTTVVRHKYSAP